MNIRIADNSDATAWNVYISSHEDATPYHDFAWKTSIENAYGFECPYLLAEDDNRNICGVLPLVNIKMPMMPGKLCSLPYCDLGGCLASEYSVEQQLLYHAVSILHNRNLEVFEYRTSAEPGDDNKHIENGKVRMLLPLPASSDALMSGFKSKLRSQIRKSEKNGLTVELGNTQYLLNQFYGVIANNMKLLGSPVHSKKWYEEISCNYKDNAIISIVRHDGCVAGGGMILKNEYTASIPWASTIREYNPLAPNMLLYWSLLVEATDLGCRVFDFGRSSFGEGTFRFKQQWGAQPVPLLWKTMTRHMNDEFELQLDTASKSKSRITAESLWQKLPLPLTVFIGSRVRKYISL